MISTEKKTTSPNNSSAGSDISSSPHPRVVLAVILGLKGGIGKSTLAACLIQKFNNSGIEQILIDADPYVKTLTGIVGAEYVEDIDLMTMEGDKIDPASFNIILDTIDAITKKNESALILVDVGSSYYEAAVNYLTSIKIEETLAEIGAEFWAITPARMTTNEESSTITSIEVLSDRFYNLLVIDNRYDGAALDLYQPQGDADPVEIIRFPALDAMKLEVLKDTLRSGKTLQSAMTDRELTFRKRSWAKQLYEDLFGGADAVFNKSKVLERIVNIAKGKSVPDVAEFIKQTKQNKS